MTDDSKPTYEELQAAVSDLISKVGRAHTDLYYILYRTARTKKLDEFDRLTLNRLVVDLREAGDRDYAHKTLDKKNRVLDVQRELIERYSDALDKIAHNRVDDPVTYAREVLDDEYIPDD